MTIEADAIPLDDGARDWCERKGDDPLCSAFTGGEDYELLFTVPAKRRGSFAGVRRLVKDPPLTRIGVVTNGSAVVLRRAGREEALPSGFEHFKS